MVLEAFLDVLPEGMRAALEPRDPSWETDEVLALLDRAGVAFVLADRPRARVRPVVTGGWSYVRFHQGALDRPDYPRRKLARWADRILDLEASGARETVLGFEGGEPPPFPGPPPGSAGWGGSCSPVAPARRRPGAPIFVYFNNDTGGAAVRDAAILREMLAARGLEVVGAARP
jgi:uncharacterized protein YecE (DUF72 family)